MPPDRQRGRPDEGAPAESVAYHDHRHVERSATARLHPERPAVLDAIRGVIAEDAGVMLAELLDVGWDARTAGELIVDGWATVVGSAVLAGFRHVLEPSRT